MKPIELGSVTYLTSDDEFRKYGMLTPSLRDRFDRAVTRGFIRNKQFLDSIQHSGLNSGCDAKVVQAHGVADREPWMYQDGKVIRPVQQLIDDLDGSAKAILLFICNPSDFEVRAQKSIVIHHKGKTNFVGHWLLGAGLRLYIPGRGYIGG